MKNDQNNAKFRDLHEKQSFCNVYTSLVKIFLGN